MNQILYVFDSKNTNTDIKKIIKFSTICSITFATILVGQGSYAMFKNSTVQTPVVNTITTNTIGTIEVPTTEKPKIEALTANKETMKITIVATSTIGLKELTYSTNGGEIKVATPGENKNRIEVKEDMLIGVNQIQIVAKDVEDNVTILPQTYEVTSKITIEVSHQEQYMYIKATDNYGMDRVQYIFNGTERLKFSAKGEQKTLEYKQELKPGINTFELEAINKNGDSEKKSFYCEYIPK